MSTRQFSTTLTDVIRSALRGSHHQRSVREVLADDQSSNARDSNMMREQRLDGARPLDVQSAPAGIHLWRLMIWGRALRDFKPDRCPMPRFFFDVVAGDREVRDEVGLDLRQADQVWPEIARLLHDHLLLSAPRAACFFDVTVRDEDGTVVARSTTTRPADP